MKMKMKNKNGKMRWCVMLRAFCLVLQCAFSKKTSLDYSYVHKLFLKYVS